jgi:hypothetical protein
MLKYLKRMTVHYNRFQMDLVPVNFIVNSLSNKPRCLEQSNYIYGPLMINQYKLPFHTQTLIHQQVSNI